MNKTNLNVYLVKGIGIILVMIGHSGMFLFIKDKALLNTFIYLSFGFLNGIFI